MPYFAEDPFGRITDVHWKKDGEPGTGQQDADDPCGMLTVEAAPFLWSSRWFLGTYQPVLVQFPQAFQEPWWHTGWPAVYGGVPRNIWTPLSTIGQHPWYTRLAEDMKKYYYGLTHMGGFSIRLEANTKRYQRSLKPLGIDLYTTTPPWDLTPGTKPDFTFVGDMYSAQADIDFFRLPQTTINFSWGVFGGDDTHANLQGFGRQNAYSSFSAGAPDDDEPPHLDTIGEWGTRMTVQFYCTHTTIGAPPPQPALNSLTGPGNGWYKYNRYTEEPFDLPQNATPANGVWAPPPSWIKPAPFPPSPIGGTGGSPPPRPQGPDDGLISWEDYWIRRDQWRALYGLDPLGIPTPWRPGLSMMWIPSPADYGL